MGEGGNFNFHFANGGWEVLMETDLPVKPKADGQDDEGFRSISAFPNIDADKFPAQTVGA
jgi:hypothetical protein